MELELVRLPNGVRIALDPMPGLATAALGVWQRVGARWEPAELNGVAHLFEHMAFKGAGARDARQFAEAIENAGANMNAATGYERTAYYARTVAEQAPFALDLIADILFEPHWAPDDLEKEKGVVAQERGEAFDAPDDRVFELHQSALYKDQPLGRPILGTEAALKNVSVDTLINFRAMHMTPERVVVSIAGAFDRDAIIDTATRRFGGLKARPDPEREAARPQTGHASETRKLEQTHLVFSWPSPPAGSDQLHAARMLSEIFGGGMSSRLFQEVRETRGLVYAIDSATDTLEDDGRLSVYAGCSAQHAHEVAEVVRGQLELMAAKGPTEAELKRAKAVTRSSMLMGLEAPSARAEARVSQLFLRDKLTDFAELRARMDAVTCGQVQAIAAKALEGPACAAAIGPKAGHGALEAFGAK
ncbi:MAG: insulinase family protein [Hyphomonadaceae bacterium]|nr:insulinase family protein [Hyphomonadaceae bacterium]